MSKTVKVRIRVAIWPNGKWIAYGDEGREDSLIRSHEDILEVLPPGESITWVTADLPLPGEVAGTVEPADA